MIRLMIGLSLVASALMLAGCNGAPATEQSAEIINTPPPPTMGSDLDHPSEGPHHGDLVELGTHEFHAEIVHGDAGDVTLYILDSSAEQAVPIEAGEVTINLKRGGQGRQYKLTAMPDAGDPPGKASRFSSEPGQAVELDDGEAQLVITIHGKQYRGKVDHDHDGHDHDDNDRDGHDHDDDNHEDH